VWDRQPNWNNIITSKEQEKDLKAFTCQKCGSTIFIAKTREFFFQGDTGIGGLGCFACGAKGAENFVMDRERIVEDVADTDDYFEYERPLDFVSRAERRKLLKEAKGDEDRANMLLLERTTGMASKPSDTDVATPSPPDLDTLVDVELSENQINGERPASPAVEPPTPQTPAVVAAEHVDEPVSEPRALDTASEASEALQPTVVATEEVDEPISEPMNKTPDASAIQIPEIPLKSEPIVSESTKTVDLVSETVISKPAEPEKSETTPPSPSPLQSKSSASSSDRVDLDGLDELDMDEL
jgi:hypothetical protein